MSETIEQVMARTASMPSRAEQDHRALGREVEEIRELGNRLVRHVNSFLDVEERLPGEYRPELPP
jgi:hypothetical protein